MADSIPVIDLQESPAGDVIRACEEWGCFRLLNFQEILPESLMLEMKAVVRSLLELPTAVKARNKASVIAGSGYMAPSAINPHYEALGLYDMASPQAVEAFCSELEATPHQRETMLKYAKAVHRLMMQVVHKIGQGLNMKDLSFEFEEWSCQFRINKYNFSPEAVGSRGVQLHTDSSFLTILQDDEAVGGLEVMKRNGHFQAVDPCPRTLIVNLGDIATVWSNGRFLNVKHRVMCKEAAGIRVSVASFLLGPKEGKKIQVPAELTADPQHPCMLTDPFTYQDYRHLRQANKWHTGEAVDYYFRVQS